MSISAQLVHSNTGTMFRGDSILHQKANSEYTWFILNVSITTVHVRQYCPTVVFVSFFILWVQQLSLV